MSHYGNYGTQFHVQKCRSVAHQAWYVSHRVSFLPIHIIVDAAKVTSFAYMLYICAIHAACVRIRFVRKPQVAQ